MKILHIIPSYDPIDGGPYQALYGMCQGLTLRGHDVTIYTTDVTSQRSINPLAFEVDRISVPTTGPVNEDGYKVYYYKADFPYSWCYSRSLAQAIATTIHTYDIVNIHSLYLYPTQISAYFSRRAAIPYIMRPHGTFDTYMRKRSFLKKYFYDILWQRRDIERAAALHYTSQDELNHAITLGFNTPTKIIPLGFDLKEYKYLPDGTLFRSKYLRGWQGKIVLYLGRLNFKKGIDLLIDGFARVCQSHTDVQLVIVGKADSLEFEAQLRKRVADQGISEKVNFTGSLFGKDKLAAFSASTMWVLPSYTENFGIALVEAMAAGLPVIVSNQVALHHEVHEADAGLIIDCDAMQVAQAIITLLDNPLKATWFGENGKKLSHNNFTLESIGKGLEQLYTEVLSK